LQACASWRRSSAGARQRQPTRLSDHPEQAPTELQSDGPEPGLARGSDLYAAFVIQAFARLTVGWQVTRTANDGFDLDALEQAIHQQQPGTDLSKHSSDDL